MAPIEGARLLEIEEAIFVQGLSMVEESAAEFSRACLVDTIRAARQALRASVDALPAAAFAPQPAADAGAPVWSAGEIVAHLTEAMLYFQFALRRLAGDNPEGEPTGKPAIAVRNRPETLALLDRADRELDTALALTATIGDDARTTLGPLGTLGVRGLLLLHAMHEWDHAGQTESLHKG